MVDFILFNFCISLVTTLLLSAITKYESFRKVQPNNMINFLFGDIKVYICLFLFLLIPFLNVLILLITLFGLVQSGANKLKRY